MFLGACTFIIAVCSTPLPNAVFGSSFYNRRLAFAISSPAPTARTSSRTWKRCGPLLPRLVSWRRWVIRFVGLLHWFALLASLRCIVCLLGLLLCACFRLFLPLLGFLILLQLAPCLVRVCAGRGQPLCPWDRGDKVVSSCWWVRACFIHPETLFQTLSQYLKHNQKETSHVRNSHLVNRFPPSLESG